MSKALTPQEAIIRFTNEIPEPVFEVWNSLIVGNLKVQNGNVNSEFFLEDLTEKLTTVMNVSRELAKDKGWFDLEDIFRDKGWKVEFNKPGYNESYPAYFKFKN